MSFVFRKHSDRINAKIKQNDFSEKSTLIIKEDIESFWLYLNKIIKNIFLDSNINIILLYIGLNSIKKEISWDFPNSQNKKILIRKIFSLYRISEGGKTLIKLTSMIKPTNNYNSIDNNYLINSMNNSLKNNDNENLNIFFKKIKDIRNQKDNQIKIEHESTLIKSKFNKTWIFLTDPIKVSQVLPLMGTNYLNYGNPLKVGNFWKCRTKKDNKIIFLRINKVSTNPKRNCWVYSMELIGSEKYAGIENIIIKVTKVGEEYTQVSVTHQFECKANKNYVKVLSFNKIDALKKIKKFLEENDL